MANRINNKYDYRSGLLDSLNVQHNASDVRNEDEYRKKVLNGLGVEFTDDDINQKSRYRAKVVEGLASSGGGGGGGENPNHIQTVTGTLANPWGEINFTELYTAIANNNATATMTIDASALGVGNVIAKLSASNVSENLIYSNGAMFSGDEPDFTVSAFNLSWWHSDGELDTAYMYSNNTINSIKTYANSLPTSLEITWHPLEATTGA